MADSPSAMRVLASNILPSTALTALRRICMEGLMPDGAVSWLFRLGGSRINPQWSPKSRVGPFRGVLATMYRAWIRVYVYLFSSFRTDDMI